MKLVRRNFCCVTCSSKAPRRGARFALFCVIGAGLFTVRAAQQPPSSSSSSSSTPAQPNQPAANSSAASASADAGSYNPMQAEKDVEVATFYMRKGDPDASIPRLEEAIRLKPNYAKPRLMLAEIYEKKDDKDEALKYYREYLQVYPHAPDAKKIEKKIAQLSKP